MQLIYYFPFIVQAGAIFFDEFYYHHKRGLGAWEKVGHPLDTLTVLLSYSFLIFIPYTQSHLVEFIMLATFSSLFITKDEFVHAELCEAGEHWLHSLLFVVHPVCFLSAALLWIENQGSYFLAAQALFLTCFMLYQIIFWGIPWKKSIQKIQD